MSTTTGGSPNVASFDEAVELVLAMLTTFESDDMEARVDLVLDTGVREARGALHIACHFLYRTLEMLADPERGETPAAMIRALAMIHATKEGPTDD